MLRFLNDTSKITPIDIFINNRKVVSHLEYGTYSKPFDAKLGLYTIKVAANNEPILQMNFQLRHTDTVITLTGNTPDIELLIIPGIIYGAPTQSLS